MLSGKASIECGRFCEIKSALEVVKEKRDVGVMVSRLADATGMCTGYLWKTKVNNYCLGLLVLLLGSGTARRIVSFFRKYTSSRISTYKAKCFRRFIVVWKLRTSRQ